MIKYNLYKLLKEELGNGSSDLVTRPSGNKIRERIEKDIAKEKDGAVIVIDFSKIGIVDYSCADEIVAKLVREKVRVLLLRGTSDAHRDAIEPVLLGHGLAAVCERPDGTLDVIGAREPAAALLEELVVQQVAARTPGGAIALTAA